LFSVPTHLVAADKVAAQITPITIPLLGHVRLRSWRKLERKDAFPFVLDAVRWSVDIARM